MVDMEHSFAVFLDIVPHWSWRDKNSTDQKRNKEQLHNLCRVAVNILLSGGGQELSVACVVWYHYNSKWSEA